VFELDESRRDELVESGARKIVERGLATAAVFLLEAHKPLAGLGSQAVLAFQPLLGSLFPVNFGELAAFMRHPDNVERLLQRIEELEGQRNHELEAARRRSAEARRRARRIRKLRRSRGATAKVPGTPRDSESGQRGAKPSAGKPNPPCHPQDA
jgi:hypothetical protein